MPIRPEHPWRAAVLLLAVLLLHGAALWLLTRRPPPPRPPARSAVALRIVVPRPPPEVPPRPAVAQATPPSPAPRRAPAAPVRRPLASERADRIEAPASPAEPAAITVAPPAPPAPATPAASAPDAPLRLDLPRRGLAGPSPRNPALDDPRANRAPAGLGDRLAQALGSDPRRTEESRGDGRLRVRQGAGCVDVRVARNAQIDPMDQSNRPTPKVVEPCP